MKKKGGEKVVENEILFQEYQIQTKNNFSENGLNAGMGCAGLGLGCVGLGAGCGVWCVGVGCGVFCDSSWGTDSIERL